MEKGFEWLSEEICREYINRAKALPPNNGLDTGPWRDLRIELQKRCNLSEVQAYNIIHEEYVHMYDILSGRIPMPEAMKNKLEKEEKKKSMAEKLREYEERIEELENLRNYNMIKGSDYGFEEKD